MTREVCPSCGTAVGEGGFSSDVGGRGLREHKTCPKCGTPLVRTMNDTSNAPERDWRRDEFRSSETKR